MAAGGEKESEETTNRGTGKAGTVIEWDELTNSGAILEHDQNRDFPSTSPDKDGGDRTRKDR